ncbi:MAG TPA: DUF4920 domain-containing protein [Pyrinomonadaceae bacterium]|nr:DUF4920 domain-containing protein [Pyrinomonadaceae bacterium]
MKTFLVSLLFVIACSVAAAAQEHKSHESHDAAKAETAKAEKDGDVIKRGSPLGTESPSVAFADVLKEPAKYAGKRVRIEGVVERVCQAEGCWMQIAPESGATGIRVTFKDHSFFVPKDSKSMKFKAEGEFSVTVLSKEQVEHLVGDGAAIKRKDDGTADEVRFVATGVELRK